MNWKLNKKSKNRKKTCKKIKHRKKTTRKHNKCKKCFKGGMTNENNNGEECPMCFTIINIQDDRVMFRNLFNCTHDFHKECIVGLVKATKESNIMNNIFRIVCPLCRARQTDNGSQVIETIDRILDMGSELTRRNMFRDLLQYDYPYDASRDTFFRLYVLPIPRRIYDVGRSMINFEFSNPYAVGRAGIFFFLSFVITGNDGRQTLRRYYSNFRTLQYFRGIFNILAITYLPNNNEFRSHRFNAVTNLFVIFIVLNLDNIFTNAPTEINTVNGRISMVDIITELINMFGRLLFVDSDFLQYFNTINDHNNSVPYGFRYCG